MCKKRSKRSLTIFGVRMSEIFFSTNDVSNLLDVSKSTVKRWTDEGKLKCYQSPGGHRKFNAENIFDFVTTYNYKNTSVDFLPFLKNDDFVLRELVLKNEHSVLQSVCLNAAIKGKKEDVVKLFTESHRAGMSLALILDAILIPTLKKIFTLCATKKISAYEVHLAKNTLSSAMILLNDHLPTQKKNMGTILCASIANERNDTEFTALISFLEISGYNVLNLGVGATAEEIIEITEKEQPAVICFYTNETENPLHLNNELENIISFLRTRSTMIALGGSVMTNGCAEMFNGLRYEIFSTFSQFEKIKLRDNNKEIHEIKLFNNN
jgi:MerR family transcriptional regulator, light-induced transcriptional regulator